MEKQFIEACKGDNPYQDVHKLYRDNYIATDKPEMYIVDILLNIIDTYLYISCKKHVKILYEIKGLYQEDSEIVVLLRTLIHHIRYNKSL